MILNQLTLYASRGGLGQKVRSSLKIGRQGVLGFGGRQVALLPKVTKVQRRAGPGIGERIVVIQRDMEFVTQRSQPLAVNLIGTGRAVLRLRHAVVLKRLSQATEIE